MGQLKKPRPKKTTHNSGTADILVETAKTPLSEQGDVKEEGIDLLVMPDD